MHLNFRMRHAEAAVLEQLPFKIAADHPCAKLRRVVLDGYVGGGVQLRLKWDNAVQREYFDAVRGDALALTGSYALSGLTVLHDPASARADMYSTDAVFGTTLRLTANDVTVRWVTLRAHWVTLRARWVTLRARWVTRRARWVTLRARWVTLRARWVTLRARWVMFRCACCLGWC
jgi:hypothetical protein